MPANRQQSDLDAMNAEINALIDRRAEWVAANTAAFARWPVSTDVFDFMTGEYVGTVTAHAPAVALSGKLDVASIVTGPNRISTTTVSVDDTVTFGSIAERKAWLTTEIQNADQKAADSKRADTVLIAEAPSIEIAR